MRKGKKMVTVLSYVILAAGLLWVSLPFVWMVLTAFKPAKEVLSMPPKVDPDLSWQWEISRWHCSKYRMPGLFFSSKCVYSSDGDGGGSNLQQYLRPMHLHIFHSGLKML